MKNLVRFNVCLLTISMGVPALSQTVSPSTAHIVPFRESNSAVPPAPPKTAQGMTEAAGSIWLQFNNSDIATVARSMSAITGRQVLVDTRVEGTLNLQSNSPVSPAAAWEMFSKALQQKKLSILSPQGMYIIAPATEASNQLPPASNELPAKPSPVIPAQGKQNTSFQSSSDDFHISLEWAKAPKTTLPQPTGSTAPVQASAEDVLAIWSLQTQDKTLYHSISRWAQSANWQLMWEAERDFPIQAQISIEGSFTAAIQMVMNSLANTDYPLQAVMNNSTRVISVIRHQDPFAR